MGKLCGDEREALISKLAALFSGVSADEIDEVVDALKTKEAKNRERLDALYQQVKTLLDKGYSEAAGMKKSRFLEYVDSIPLRDKFEIGDLVVIPERIVPIHKQMQMLMASETYLDLGMLTQADGVETPNIPYLIRDVEDGAAMRNTSPDNCVKQFNEQGRFGLTIEEGIAIITHKPETLNNHYIDLPGFRYGSRWVPDLWLDNGRPELSYGRTDFPRPLHGSASCGSRIRA